MTLARSIALILAVMYLAWATNGFAQQSISEDFERCKIITDDQVRLACFKDLLPKSSAGPSLTAQDSWPLIRTPHPNGGPDAIAIMRTADTAQSDPDLAGLMIRCEEKSGLKVLLALVRPFPPRSKRDVLVTSGTTQLVLHAETSPAGTALILPIEATAFTTGPWQGLKELAVAIKDPETEVRGVIPLGGIALAMAKLSASCPAG